MWGTRLWRTNVKLVVFSWTFVVSSDKKRMQTTASKLWFFFFNFNQTKLWSVECLRRGQDDGDGIRMITSLDLPENGRVGMLNGRLRSRKLRESPLFDSCQTSRLTPNTFLGFQAQRDQKTLMQDREDSMWSVVGKSCQHARKRGPTWNLSDLQHEGGLELLETLSLGVVNPTKKWKDQEKGKKEKKVRPRQGYNNNKK